MFNDTIVAISTAVNDGAISIIRLSGDDAIEVVNKIFSKDLSRCSANTINYGTIFDEKETVDEVLVSLFRAPKTFTSEDVVEINTHGGTYVTRQVLGLCLANGARLAERGEFTKRAYLNGRIDMAQAEAINDIINAKDQANAKLAIKGIKGSVKKLINPLIDDLLKIIAQIEVNIDYPEYEDVELLTNEKLLPQTKILIERINRIIKRANNTKTVKQGVSTAIIGKPNVGKSSLLNALLEEDKAIVTEIPGTTRDLVEGIIHLDNISLHLFDTAGIHSTEDIVEKIGIDKSKVMLNEAELVILVLDNSRALSKEDHELFDLVENMNTIVVFNKQDVNKVNRLEYSNSVNISALKNDIDPLIERINDMYKDYQDLIDNPSLNNDRQIACLISAKKELEEAMNAMNLGYELDLVTINLQESFYNLKDILGQRNKDDLLDALFANFCLGK
jgi:tRNA modification GTPase